MDVQAALGSCVSANNKTTWRVMNASITRDTSSSYVREFSLDTVMKVFNLVYNIEH